MAATISEEMRSLLRELGERVTPEAAPHLWQHSKATHLEAKQAVRELEWRADLRARTSRQPCSHPRPEQRPDPVRHGRRRGSNRQHLEACPPPVQRRNDRAERTDDEQREQRDADRDGKPAPDGTQCVSDERNTARHDEGERRGDAVAGRDGAPDQGAEDASGI